MSISVCNTHVCNQTSKTLTFIFDHQVYREEIRVKFVYVKVKATGAIKGKKSLFQRCETLIGDTSGAVWGFRLWRIEWCDRR